MYSFDVDELNQEALRKKGHQKICVFFILIEREIKKSVLILIESIERARSSEVILNS